MQSTAEWTWSEERQKFTTKDGDILITLSPGALAFCEISGVLMDIDHGVWQEARKAAHDAHGLDEPETADYAAAVAQLMGELEDAAEPKHDRRIAKAAAIAHEALSYL